ncbi:MAG: tail fiber domain-containing protein [Prevotellaceae bacterium]|nr:tail fiber domain-containing protein [Prevotellaceae bacterium]
MKKLNLILVCAFAIQFANAQLKVQSNGNVVINPTSTTVTGQQLRVNTAESIGIYVNNTAGQAGIKSYSTSSTTYVPAYTAGVFGHGRISATTGGACAFGVWGESVGVNSYGRNFGVLGSLDYAGIQISNGAGIVGVGGNWQLALQTFSQKYAGYFIGDTHVDGLLSATSTSFNSDIRYKQNIVGLSNELYNKLLNLNPVEFNFKQRYSEFTDSLGNNVQLPLFEKNSQLLTKKHYGLIAQEVQEIYPDLVYEDGEGYLSVDYVGIIPLLIASVKELKNEIEELKNAQAQAQPQNAPAKQILPAALYQNAPNPFNENTEISFYLPETVSNAVLCVYDMNGKQLSQTAITERGNAKLTLNGRRYGAGMYLYSLIADNQVIDTKRMILTK